MPDKTLVDDPEQFDPRLGRFFATQGIPRASWPATANLLTDAQQAELASLVSDKGQVDVTAPNKFREFQQERIIHRRQAALKNQSSVEPVETPPAAEESTVDVEATEETTEAEPIEPN